MSKPEDIYPSISANEVPEGMVIDPQSGIVGFGTRYGESSSSQPLETLGDGLPTRIYLDTSFLINLVGRSMPRRRTALNRGDNIDTRERHLRARRRWDEFLARKAHNPEMRAYWSPIVLQEFIYATARGLLALLLQDPTQISDPNEQSLRVSILDLIGLDAFAKLDVHRPSIVPSPEFIARVLPVIDRSLTPLLRKLTLVADAGEENSGSFLSDYLEILRWEFSHRLIVLLHTYRQKAGCPRNTHGRLSISGGGTKDCIVGNQYLGVTHC